MSGWLLGLALVASPGVALAQNDGEEIELDEGDGEAKPPGEGTDGGDVEELDGPPKPPPGSEAAGGEGAEGEGGGGICEIDPSACPKDTDIKKSADREISAEIYAVQQIYALRRQRFELNPYWGFTLNDQFVSHPGPGLAVNYYLTNVLAVGINGTWYGGLNVDSDFNFENRRATRVAVPLNEYQWNGNLNFTYVPVYGKFAGFGDFIFHYDAYIVGGVGAISTRPIPVIDPDNRNFSFEPKLAFNAGVGLRIFLNRWFAATMELRDYAFIETLENLNVAATQQEQLDPATWTDEKQLTNHIQAQLGVSVFLPFSWEYRLPK